MTPMEFFRTFENHHFEQNIFNDRIAQTHQWPDESVGALVMGMQFVQFHSQSGLVLRLHCKCPLLSSTFHQLFTPELYIV